MDDKKKNSLCEDLFVRLPDVQRRWLRWPFTIIATPIAWVILVVVAALEGVYNATISTWDDFFLDCWKGQN